MKSISDVLRGDRIRDQIRFGFPPALRLGGAFLQLLVTVLIARALGAEQAGEFFFWSMTLMTIGQVSTFGLDRLTLQQLPRLEDSPEKRSRFLGTVRAASMAVALVFGSLLIFYAVFLQSEMTRPVWWYFLPPLCTAGVALCMINGDAMIASSRPVSGIFFRHTLTTTIFFAGAVALILGDRLSPDFALGCFSLAFVVAGIGALFSPGFRSLGPGIILPRPAEFVGLFRQGLPICMTSAFTALASIAPLAILEQTHPGDQVAFLTTAFRLFFLFEILANAIHSLALPKLSRAAHAGDRTELAQVYRTTLIRAALMLGPVMLGMIIFAGPVMSLFGEDFGADSAAVLRVFLVFGLVSLLCGPANHLILMTGRTRTMAAIAFGRMIGTALIALAVVPRFGPAGMAVVFGVGLLMEKALCIAGALRAEKKAGTPSRPQSP